MNEKEYIRVFLSGKGKEHLELKKILKNSDKFILIDTPENAEIILIPEEKQRTEEDKENLIYAKELGITVFKFKNFDKGKELFCQKFDDKKAMVEADISEEI